MGVELSGDGELVDALEETSESWGSDAETREISNDTSYADDVEFGTAAHEISVNSAPVLTNGTEFFGKTVQHPGTDPQPMLRPAADVTAANMGRIARTADDLDQFLQLTSDYFYGEVVSRTPVDTGRLKNAWEQSGG